MEAHTSGDEEVHHLDPEAHDPGAIAHESSSQSSLENGDPHTPSPLYSEAIINRPENGINPQMQKTLTMDNVDPHFARLLSSLSLSAKKTTEAAPAVGNAPEPLIYASPSKPPPSQAQHTPLNARSPSQPSVAKPPRSSRTPAPRTSPTSSSTATVPRSSSRIGYNTPPRISTLSPSHSVVISPAVGGHAPMSSSPITRRTVPPVDISPYLTRAATAAPPIPKQMKYISMLESMAQESERMTPKIERQLARGGQNFTMPGLPQGIPASASMFNAQRCPPGESSVIYSSRSGPQIGFPLQAHLSFPQMPSTTSEDPFLVRPRTSNAIHPASYNSMSTRPSLTDDQLRLMMSLTGPRGPPMPPAGPYPPQAFMAQPPNGTQFLGPHAPYAPSRLQPPPNLRVIPQQQLSTGQFIDHPPMSAPAMSPTFNLPPRGNPANNAHLLSILNNPTIPRPAPSGPHALLGNVGPS